MCLKNRENELLSDVQCGFFLYSRTCVNANDLLIHPLYFPFSKNKRKPTGLLFGRECSCRASQHLTFDQQPPTAAQTLPASPDRTDGTHSQLLWDSKSEQHRGSFGDFLSHHYFTFLSYCFWRRSGRDISRDAAESVRFYHRSSNSTDISESVDMLLADMKSFWF